MSIFVHVNYVEVKTVNSSRITLPTYNILRYPLNQMIRMVFEMNILNVLLARYPWISQNLSHSYNVEYVQIAIIVTE